MTRKPAPKIKNASFVPMKSKRPLPFQLKDLIDVVQMMEKYGQLEKFTRYVKRNGLTISLPRETVNCVKEFVANDEDLRADRVGKKIIVPKKKPRAAIAGVAFEASLRPAKRDPYKDCCGF
ncbi:MAG: hypothetical protein AB7U61_16220 [Methylocystis sp.]